MSKGRYLCTVKDRYEFTSSAETLTFSCLRHPLLITFFFFRGKKIQYIVRNRFLLQPAARKLPEKIKIGLT